VERTGPSGAPAEEVAAQNPWGLERAFTIDANRYRRVEEAPIVETQAVLAPIGTHDG